MPPQRPNNNQSTDGIVPPAGAGNPPKQPEATSLDPAPVPNQPVIDPELRPVPYDSSYEQDTDHQPTPESTAQQPHVSMQNTPFIDNHDNSANSPKKNKKREEIKNTILTIMLFILAPLFAVFMIIFVFQSYVVDGSSMYPTLHNTDRVFILKMPKTLANFKGSEWVPERNEIIVFKKPGNEGTQLIKRVIGLPGDRVVIKDGNITIFNLDRPEGFNPATGTEYDGTLESYSREQNMESNIGEGEIFVLGDNRTPGGSLDSHSGLGLVPVDHIVGRLWIRYFPLSSFEVFADNLSQPIHRLIRL